MIIKNNKLISNGIILSLPGILSIFISLISIPIHLNISMQTDIYEIVELAVHVHPHNIPLQGTEVMFLRSN